MFKRLLLISSAAAALLVVPQGFTPAGAADLPPPPPPPLRESLDWTGIYIGGVAGVACAVIDNQPFIPGTPINPDEREEIDGCTFSGGGLAGFNYQFNSRIVAGIEGDFTVQTGDYESLTSPGGETQYGTEFLSTIRGRLGYLATDRTMLYVTAGVAFGEVEVDGQSPGPVPFADDEFLVGYAAGAGVEHALNDHIKLRAEYLFIDLGDETFDATGGVGTAFLDGDIEQIHQLRVGASYHFKGFGGAGW